MERRWRRFCEKSGGLCSFALPRWVRPGRCASLQRGGRQQAAGTARHTQVRLRTHGYRSAHNGYKPPPRPLSSEVIAPPGPRACLRCSPLPRRAQISLSSWLNARVGPGRGGLDNHKASVGGCLPLMRSPRVSGFTFLRSPLYPYWQRAGAAISTDLLLPPALGRFRGELVTELALQNLALKGLPSPSQLKQRAVQ